MLDHGSILTGCTHVSKNRLKLIKPVKPSKLSKFPNWDLSWYSGVGPVWMLLPRQPDDHAR